MSTRSISSLFFKQIRKIPQFMKTNKLSQSGSTMSKLLLGVCFYQGYEIIQSKRLHSLESNENKMLHSIESNLNIQKSSNVKDVTQFRTLNQHFPHNIVISATCPQDLKLAILEFVSRQQNKRLYKITLFTRDQFEEPVKQNSLFVKKPQAIIDPEFSSDVLIVNQYGDLREFNLADKKTDSDQLSIEMNSIFNFLEPLEVYKDQENSNQIFQMLNQMAPDTRIVLSFIPQKLDYESQVQDIKKFDQFSKGKVHNITRLEEIFREIRYNHNVNDTRFVLLRSQALADIFNLSSDNVGDLFVIQRSTHFNDKQSSFVMQGKQFSFSQIQSDPNIQDEPLSLSAMEQEKKIFLKKLDYVNEINIENDLKNFLRSSEAAGMKKFLVFYSAEAVDKQFEDQVLQKLMKTQQSTQIPLQIIYTRNPLLLRKYFSIIPEVNADTIRFIDMDFQGQSGIIESQKESYQDTQNLSLGNINLKVDVPYEVRDTTTLENGIFSKYLHAQKFKYEGKITRQRLTNFIISSSNCKDEKMAYLENEPTNLFPFSNYLHSSNIKKEVFNQEDQISVVFFFKPSCASCSTMKKGFQLFSNILTEMHSALELKQEGQFVYKPNEKNIFNDWKVSRLELFSKVKSFRYCIYNENDVFPSPSATPLIFVFAKGYSNHPILIDVLKENINLNHPEQVAQFIFRSLQMNL